MARILGLPLRMLALCLLALGAGAIVNALRPDGLALSVGLPGHPTCGVPDIGLPIEMVSVHEAARLCAGGDVLVADARDAERFMHGHIAGAVHLPCATSGRMASRIPELLAGRRLVLVYADSTAEAVAVADGLLRRRTDPGQRIIVLQGGFADWEAAGHACLSGECPDCLEHLP